MPEQNFKASKLSLITDLVKFAKDKNGEDQETVPFEGVAYAGGIVKLGYMGRVIVDLGSFSIPAKTPMLFHHDGKQIVGHAKLSVDEGKLYIDGIVYNDDLSPEGQSIVSKSKKGFPWKLSIGWIWEKRQFLSKGVSAVVNGKKVSGPITILSGNVLDEVSFTGIPADRNTKVKVAASSDDSTMFFMNEESANQLKQDGDFKTMNDDEKDTSEKGFADAKDKIKKLEGQLSAEEEKVEALTKDMDNLKLSVRKDRLKGLDGKLSEKESESLMKMDDVAFDFVVGKLSSESEVPEGLLGHLAKDGTDPDADKTSANGTGKASVDLVKMAKDRATAVAG